MINKYVCILVLSVLIATISQIILKIGSGKNYKTLIREYLNVYVIVGYAMMVISTILTIFAFKGLDYKNGPIIESIGYVFIMVLSSMILKEKITKKRVIGNILILLGIVVFYI